MTEHQEHSEKKAPLVGMRTIKTVFAVFICCLIDFFRAVIPVQSTIAAVICMQPHVEDSVQTSLSRIIATLLGGISAALTLFVFSNLGLPNSTPFFYLIISLLLLPLIVITVKSGWPSATALTCVVFLVVVLNTDDLSPFLIAAHRMMDTCVGIAVALVVNLSLPSPTIPCGEVSAEPKAAVPDTPPLQPEVEKEEVDKPTSSQ